MTNSIFYNIKNKYYQNIRKNNIQLVTIKSKLTQRNTNHQTLSATYNMFRDPISISENTTVNFDYNYNNQRSRVTYANSAKTKYYSEGMQVEVIKNNNDYKFITYIDGDPYSANIIYVKTQSSSGYYYLHRDNQGTILGISDSSGIMIEQRIFDPWGNLKQGSISFIERGYTGHEHFLEINLIHMNARLYDPVKKMFLTPDNVLQDPYNPQNYNKFGYCLNNPLKYTDPSGNVIPALLFVGVGVSAFISGLFYVAQNAYNQQGFDWGGLGLSILQGAVSGAAAYGIGSAFTTASVVAALGKTGTIFAQAAAHGLSQATISGIFRGDFSNFGSDFAAGAVSSLVGSGISKLQIDNPALRKLSMYLGGAISGGLAASVTGGDFLDGAATGLIVTALNHGLHDIFDPLTSEQQEKQNERKTNYANNENNVRNSPFNDKVKPSSEFLKRRQIDNNEPHSGTDYPVAEGTEIHATANGKVIRSYYSTTFGNTVIIEHGAGKGGEQIFTLYGHGSERLVFEGQEVKVNDVIMKSGNTGTMSRGPHLHYEVIKTNLSPFHKSFFRNTNFRYSPNQLKSLF